jgi:polyphosphate glucokinase
MEQAQEVKPLKILAIDVGGTNLKVKCSTGDEVRKVASGPKMTADKMAAAVKEMTHDWEYDVISMGFPGPVLHGKITLEPRHLGSGWVQYNFVNAFGKPIKIINDSAMQAIGSYEGGRMLLLDLGTGLGTALIVDGVVQPLEMGHLPYKKGRTYEEYVGVSGLKRLGKKRWRKAVAKVAEELTAALEPDYVVLGGGNAKFLEELPVNCRLGANANAFVGGFRMWSVVMK